MSITKRLSKTGAKIAAALIALCATGGTMAVVAGPAHVLATQTLPQARPGTMAVVAVPAWADPTFATMNDAGGIYWRSAPDWNTPVAQAGNGFYPGTAVSVRCYQSGTAVPGSADTMWVQASWASGPGHGSGWINEHFINDGAPINQAAPGVPPCNAPAPPPPAPTPTPAPTQPPAPSAPAPLSSAQKAINWAQSKLGQTAWDGLCLNFVYQAYLSGAGVNITGGLPYAAAHNTAYTYWTVAPNHHTDGRTPGIHTFNIRSYQQNLYLGWVQNF